MLHKSVGEDHPEAIRLLRNVGELQLSRRELDDGRHSFERALELQLAAFGERSDGTAGIRNSLALVHIEQGEWVEAESLLTSALWTRETLHGADHPDLCKPLLNLATTLQALVDGGGREAQRFQMCSRASGYLRRALSIRLSTFGEHSQKTAEVYLAEARFARWRGQRAQAERQQRRAYALLLEVLPASHPEVQAALEQLLLFLHDAERTSQLLRELKSYRAALTEGSLHPSNMASGMGEREDTESSEVQWRWLCEHVNLLISAANLRGAQAICEAELERLLESGGTDAHVPQLAAGLACMYRQQGKARQLQTLYSRVSALSEEQEDASSEPAAHFRSRLFSGRPPLRRHATQPAVMQLQAATLSLTAQSLTHSQLLQRAQTMPVMAGPRQSEFAGA